MTKTKVSKRILSVKITREIDTDPDTSHLGDYSDRATSAYSIDRQHADDCVTCNPISDGAKQILRNARFRIVEIQERVNPNSDEWFHLEDAYRLLDEMADDYPQCDCGGHGDMRRNEYQYFNPSFNYVTKEDKPKDGLTPDEIRQYVRQDYERLEALYRGDWAYIGIRAVAEIAIEDTVQKITSGGLWGIESDSDRTYLESVSNDELDGLKTQLRAIGFSEYARRIQYHFNPNGL